MEARRTDLQIGGSDRMNRIIGHDSLSVIRCSMDLDTGGRGGRQPQFSRPLLYQHGLQTCITIGTWEVFSRRFLMRFPA
jgi:hypothetical protein